MTWQLSLLLFYVFAAAGTVSQRVYAQRTHLPRIIPPALAFTLGVMPVSLIGALILGNFWINWSWYVVGLLAVQGILIGLSFMLGFKALRYLYGSHYEIINQLSTLIAIFGGVLLLGEALRGGQYIAASLLMAGALLAARSSLPEAVTGRGRAYNHRGLLLTLAATIALGLGMVAEKAVLDTMSLSAYVVYGFGIQSLAVLLFALPSIRSHYRQINKLELRRATMYGICLGVSGLCYIFALQKADNLSLVAAAAAFQMPVSVVACILILRERHNLWQIVFAVTLSALGLGLLY